MLSLSTIYIDTSHLNKLIKDFWCSTNVERRKKAQGFLSYLDNNGIVIFISHHTLHELLAIKDDAIVQERLNFLEQLPVIATASYPNNESILGHWMDVLRLELIFQLSNPEAEYSEICSSQRDAIVKYTSGAELMNSIRDTYIGLRDYGTFETQPTIALESILHSSDGSLVDDMKLSDLDKAEFKTKEELDDDIPKFVHHTVTNLKQKGDKRLEELEPIAFEFASRVVTGGGKLLDSSDKPKSRIYLDSLGVRPDQVTPDTTFREVSDIHIFNKTIDQFVEDGAFSSEQSLRLDQSTVPSWTIIREIEYLMRKEPRATGSSVIDREHMVYLSYVDMMSCDKRVAHYINISKKPHPILKRAKDICKAKPSYTDLI